MKNVLSGDSSFGMDMFELEESMRISDWQKWIKRAEKLFGGSLDGCQWDDGYSLDGANDAFDAGKSPQQYVSTIKLKRTQQPCHE